MKITKSQLKRIIKEEMESVIQEQPDVREELNKKLEAAVMATQAVRDFIEANGKALGDLSTKLHGHARQAQGSMMVAQRALAGKQ
jgi:hypothetical protein